MKTNRLYTFSLFLLMALLLFSCVKEIFPKLDSDEVNKLVVNAQLTNIIGYQKVNISYSSSIGEPENKFVDNCIVKLEDSNGFEYAYSSNDNGDYSLWLDSGVIDLGLKYKLSVVTPDGQHIESSWESFALSSDISDVYYKIEKEDNSHFATNHYRLQFYTNLKANENDSRYYLFDLTETYEFHAEYPIEWWYDGEVHHVSPPDYSKHICYNVFPIKDIFVLSTANFDNNEYDEFVLNYVYNEHQKLDHLYSLLVRQIALNEKSYNYWNQMKINKHQDGGLYTNQPFAIMGNLRNVSDTNKRVLGYFTVGTASEKRIFVPPPGIESLGSDCFQTPLRFGLREISAANYPVYLVGDYTGYKSIILDEQCVDCTAFGNGTTTKPSYWP